MSGAGAVAVGRRLGSPWRALPSIPPRWRRRLLMLGAVAALLAAGYQLWLRDSSFVAVEKVTITGLSTSDAERVRVSLTAAGRSMTTLHVDHESLERAVAGYSVVRELEVTTDFPHGMHIHVVEHVAAAIAAGDDGRIPVAGDGTILRGLPVEGRLPTIEVEGGLGTERLRDGSARSAVAIAGAAPDLLRPRIAEIERDDEHGLVAQLREGPELFFGDPTDLRAKWAAAARVLADLEASGASYIDLRLPGRPAAGGLPAETVTPVAPAGQTSVAPPALGVAPPPTGSVTTTPPVTTVPPVTTAPPAATTPPTGGATSPTYATEPLAQPDPALPPDPTVPLTGGTTGGALAP
jgi:cell division protein FtsQ